ncbi:hypothetical protein F0562_011416 [Nyssa sinensis]|uniref:Uncharacterized protein n=1 Tax=Nyssa sinensis TaxID=561372 RepID=A0A5J5A4J1_9ASTE|nr:hypothetical protein F0562_011416 [Nyssa sinensis]
MCRGLHLSKIKAYIGYIDIDINWSQSTTHNFHLTLYFLKIWNNGEWGCSVGFLAQYVRNEDQNSPSREGYSVRVQGRGLEEQEPTPPQDEPGSQENPGSHPRW